MGKELNYRKHAACHHRFAVKTMSLWFHVKFRLLKKYTNIFELMFTKAFLFQC